MILFALVLLLALVFALVFIVPIFANLFAGLGVDLPISPTWLGILPVWLLMVLTILIPLFLFAALTFVLWRLVRRLANQ